MFMDAFQSATTYPKLLTDYTSNKLADGTFRTGSKDLYCNLRKVWTKKELDPLLLKFNMCLYLYLGFYGAAGIIFLIQIVVNIRLIIFPIEPEQDPKGQPVLSIWHRLKDKTYRLATLCGDVPIIVVACGLYTLKRGKDGLGCWECQTNLQCTNYKTYDKLILAGSQWGLTISYISIVLMTFYKAFSAFYIWANPGACDCECKALRCCSGCFLALIIMIMLMTPSWMILQYEYYSKKEIKTDFIWNICDKMMLIGIIIWAVILLLACCIPVKNYFMGNKDDKKK